MHAVRFSDASLVFERSLGSYAAFISLKDILIDPELKCFYVIARDRVEGY
jgi:hypothetical protein